MPRDAVYFFFIRFCIIVSLLIQKTDVTLSRLQLTFDVIFPFPHLLFLSIFFTLGYSYIHSSKNLFPNNIPFLLPLFMSFSSSSIQYCLPLWMTQDREDLTSPPPNNSWTGSQECPSVTVWPKLSNISAR